MYVAKANKLVCNSYESRAEVHTGNQADIALLGGLFIMTELERRRLLWAVSDKGNNGGRG